VGRLTHYHAETYAVHPFREGNTRSPRVFLGQLAGEAGHPIAWEHLDHPCTSLTRNGSAS
jgi:cell filamentation protein